MQVEYKKNSFFLDCVFFSLSLRRFSEKANVLKIYCGVEQLVARWAHNPKAVGSSPTPATM